MRVFGKLFFALWLVPSSVLGAPDYTPDNRLMVPADYRQWVFLTSSLDLNYGNAAGPGADQMHMLDNVFVNPAAYQAFLEKRRMAG